jgi:hypothetical protein
MRKAVAKCAMTKIHGQPTNQDINFLDNELTAISLSFPSGLGGGLHGHAGLVTSDADYAIFAPGTPFIVPANPGSYPPGVHNEDRGKRNIMHWSHNSRHASEQ